RAEHKGTGCLEQGVEVDLAFAAHADGDVFGAFSTRADRVQVEGAGTDDAVADGARAGESAADRQHPVQFVALVPQTLDEELGLDRREGDAVAVLETPEHRVSHGASSDPWPCRSGTARSGTRRRTHRTGGGMRPVPVASHAAR